MGTTSQKLTYLNTTKQLLKAEINKINNVLDDNSTFRSYPQELFNGYLDVLNNGTDTLWNNLEKVSQTGTEAVLEGVETAPMKMVLNGNTSQDGTPTPDTPVEVKVVKGENVVSVSGKNLFNSNVNNYTISNTGEFVNGSDRLACDYEKINGNKITFSQTSGSGFFGVAFYDNNKNYISRFISGGVVSSITSDIPSGATYVRAFIQLPNNETANAQSIEKYKMMLELNSTATPYVPYSKTDYEVNLGKNLADISLGFRNGYLNTDTGAFVSENQSYVLNQYIEVKGETAYTYSLNNTITNMSIWSFDKNKNFIKREKIVYSKNVSTITTDSNAKYIVLGGNYNNSTTITQEILESLDIQLELGSTATSYSSYFTPIELCKINTYKDYFHKDSGKWYVHKKIGKKIFNGTENWSFITPAYATTKSLIPNINAPFNATTLKCSHFIIKQNATANIGEFRVGNQNLNFNFDNGEGGVANFKTWLSNNNVTLYYVLATPTEEEITNTTLISQLEAIANAKSVKDKTYITQTNDDLPFILDVEAIKEYEVV